MSRVITQSFLMDYESRMSRITENEYSRLSSNMWWSRVAKTRPSQSRREIVSWFLQTASIEDLGKHGGEMVYETLVEKYTEFEHKHFGKGLKLHRDQFTDLDGNGIEAGSEWSSAMGALMSYWPQKKVAELIKNGHASTSIGYDGQIFFSAAHPVNPFKASAGTFANIFTGAASGSYPGACKIDDSVDLATARVNLGKIFAYIRSLKMPNGVDPRMLRARTIMGPPRMQERLYEVTKAKFIAGAVGSAGGSTDVEAVVKSFNYDEPIVADELADYESDTTFFVVCEQLQSSQLGSLIYIEREPFKINYYTGDGGTNVDLARTNEFEWLVRGRNSTGYGHPYLIFKCKAS
jgi:phage major head subunit gpT-like protein